MYIYTWMCIAVIERYSCQYIGQSFDTDWEKENSYLTVLAGTEFYANRTSLWWINIANMQVKFSMFNRRYIFVWCHFSLLCLFISGFWGDSLPRSIWKSHRVFARADWRKKTVLLTMTINFNRSPCPKQHLCQCQVSDRLFDKLLTSPPFAGASIEDTPLRPECFKRMEVFQRRESESELERNISNVHQVKKDSLERNFTLQCDRGTMLPFSLKSTCCTIFHTSCGAFSLVCPFTSNPHKFCNNCTFHTLDRPIQHRRFNVALKMGLEDDPFLLGRELFRGKLLTVKLQGRVYIYIYYLYIYYLYIYYLYIYTVLYIYIYGVT